MSTHARNHSLSCHHAGWRSLIFAVMALFTASAGPLGAVEVKGTFVRHEIRIWAINSIGGDDGVDDIHLTTRSATVELPGAPRGGAVLWPAGGTLHINV